MNNKNFKKNILIIFYMIVAIFILGFNKSRDLKIYENTYINNINVSNMDYNQAKKIVEDRCKLDYIKLKYKDNQWIIDANDFNLSYDIDDCVENVINYTNTKSKFINIRRKYNLRKGNAYKVILSPSYDEIKLSEIIKNITDDIKQDKIEGSIFITDLGEMIKNNSKEGIKVDTVDLKEEIYNNITNIEDNEINIPIIIDKPIITTDKINSIDSVLGQYSTSFNHRSSRGKNIELSSKETSDILLDTEDVFSYNESTGARTYSKGYKSAKIIVGGKYINGEAGGVCQVSSTIYNAALVAGMKINEVHSHTFKSSYVPIGRDSAVSYGYIDLKIENNHKNPIYIKNTVNNGILTTKIYGNKNDKNKIYIDTESIYEKEKIKVKTYRVYLDNNNQQIKREEISENIYKVK